MEKTQLEVDLDEWEYLPDHGFLDLNNEDSDDKKIFSAGKRGSTNSTTVFNMNYFMCPSPTSEKVIEAPAAGEKGRFSRRVGGYQQVVPVSIQLEPRFVKNKPDDDDVTKNIILMTEKKKMMKVNKDPDFGSIESNQDAVSQVFFKKMKENEFVDMKMDSPKSPTSRNIMPPQLDAAAFNFDDNHPTEAMESINSFSPRKKIMDSDTNQEGEIVDWEENNNGGGFDLWKWSLTGIGAICSFGVAAATICIIIFSSQHKQQQQQHNAKLRFQIYAEDKRIKQAVQQAAKFNEAISVVRGVPITRAHITYGGYYDSL